jgi:hypothetical protein
VSKILAGDDTLAPSEEGYDWLGPGTYFWEHGPQRAFDWAKDENTRDPRKIGAPAVLGAYINLGQCFDLLDTANTLRDLYPEFRAITKRDDFHPLNDTPCVVTPILLSCAREWKFHSP